MNHISFFVNTTTYSTPPQSITLNKGLVATTQAFGPESYTFALLDDVTVPVSDNEAAFQNIPIYEGLYLTSSFTVSSFDIFPNLSEIIQKPHSKP